MPGEGSDLTTKERFAWTLVDTVMQMALGSISTISSSLILYIIFRSPVKLKSTYHRIMTLVSSFDICVSASLALATIPIPKSSIPYEGPTLGTNGTCIAQGLFVQFGAFGTTDSTLCLAWFYVCTALRVKQSNIKKIYEPIFYTYILLRGVLSCFFSLKLGYINIRHWSGYCSLSPIPSSCWDEQSTQDDINCEWPTEPHPYLTMAKLAKMYTLALFCLIILAMAIIIFVVCWNERKTRSIDGTAPPSPLKRTRLIVRQASMYILAFFLTWVFLVIPWDSNSPEYVDVLESILVPLGGFWNTLIFLYSKIYLLREADTAIESNFDAFKLLLKYPDSVPEVILSGIENVEIGERITDDEPDVDKDESYYTSHPSAYDDLSVKSPSTGQEAHAPGSVIVKYTSSDAKKIYKNYAEVADWYKLGHIPSDNRDGDMSSTGLSFDEKKTAKVGLPSTLPSAQTPITVGSKGASPRSSQLSPGGERLYKTFAGFAARYYGCREGDIENSPSDSRYDDVSSIGLSFDEEKDVTECSADNAMFHYEQGNEHSESLSCDAGGSGYEQSIHEAKSATITCQIDDQRLDSIQVIKDVTNVRKG